MAEKAQFPGCLMKWKWRFSYYYDCQAVMRKFTLAGKAIIFAKVAMKRL